MCGDAEKPSPNANWNLHLAERRRVDMGADKIPVTGCSSLLIEGLMGQFVGFAHKQLADSFIDIAVYWVDATGYDAQDAVKLVEKYWVLCVSEGRGTYDIRMARRGLGRMVEARHFARFAQRKIDGDGVASFADVRRLLEESVAPAGFIFEWWNF